jgi:hypothetical protein
VGSEIGLVIGNRTPTVREGMFWWTTNLSFSGEVFYGVAAGTFCASFWTPFHGATS